ncbi:MAG: mannose-1-phosphate guanylyltransferase/mannose-6-phosphate isomerase [Sphingomonadaceae bacterium]|nr:mannose-1-phosphate guanylyltransferase/mannose-6-phosphate isomerase [Sphingomonadaceae bacterium]
MIWPVILSGGSGTRLWPLSRLETPKQLLPLVGDLTMIQATAARTADAARFHAPIIVANESHRRVIDEQMAAEGIAAGELLLEPAGRNTAPAIAMAAHRIVARDAAGLMLIMPSDHVIIDAAAFLAAIERLVPFVRDGWLATFGIRATRPETGYGYIRLGDRLGAGVHAVRSFVEKPDRATAEAYLASGDYAWNGGIFLMRADRYLAALAANAPAIAAAIDTAMAGATVDGHVVRPDPAAFAACPSDSIDYAVMERDDRVAVAPVDMGWSDIGSWDALWEIAERDADGNAVRGDAVLVDTTNSLIRSDGPLVSVIGLDGVSVVASRDSVMIAARGRGQDVKKIVDALAADGRREHIDAARRDHGWGTEEVLTRAEAMVVRMLTIEPGRVMVASAARLTQIEGAARADEAELTAGVQVAVDAGARVTALGDQPARLIAIKVKS